jgi:hypothetical protein
MSRAFDVGSAGLEQAQVPLVAPGRVLAQVQRVGLAGQSGVTGQETSQSQLFLAVNTGSATAITVDVEVVVAVIGYLLGWAETPEAGPAKVPATMLHPTVNPPR